MVKQTFYDLKINSIKRETAGSSRIKFSLPDSLYEKFNHKPGQYVSVRFNMKKEDYTRTYSISSEPNKNFIEIGVKHIKNGMFSEFLKTKKIEDVVQISNPDGSFVVNSENANHLLLIAAGSGITPIMSILKSTLRRNNKSRITLLYSNKTYADMMYKTEIQDLKDKYLDRLLVFNFFSRELQSTEFLNGRITQDKIAYLSDRNLIDLEDLDQCFICGPLDMTKSLQSYLKDKGVAEKKITTELFFVATDKKREDISQKALVSVIASHPFHKICIIDIGISWIKSDEFFRCGIGLVKVTTHIMSIDQISSCLLSINAKRIKSLYSCERINSTQEVFCIYSILCHSV